MCQNLAANQRRPHLVLVTCSSRGVQLQAVCMFDKFHFDIQLQIQSVTWRFQNTKWRVNWHLRVLLKLHLNVACSGAVSFQFLNVNWRVVFPFTSQILKLCVSIDVHFIFVQVFACQVSKTCKNFVKHTHWLQVIVDVKYWGLKVSLSNCYKCQNNCIMYIAC
jgi:hypothetical protein